VNFYTSDLHFWHKNVIEYCNRPFACVEEMNSELVRRWNAVVSPDDKVWILGDLAFSKPAKVLPLIQSLNGHLMLVRGNHDPRPTQCLKMGIHDVMNEKCVWEIGGIRVILSHYPYGDLRYPQRAPKDEGDWLLHGHVHCGWKVRDRMINVGVDVWNYAPVSEAELLAIMRA
jgi:calcineurin-like phosphoesterase family protein